MIGISSLKFALDGDLTQRTFELTWEKGLADVKDSCGAPFARSGGAPLVLDFIQDSVVPPCFQPSFGQNWHGVGGGHHRWRLSGRPHLLLRCRLTPTLLSTSNLHGAHKLSVALLLRAVASCYVWPGSSQPALINVLHLVFLITSRRLQLKDGWHRSCD